MSAHKKQQNKNKKQIFLKNNVENKLTPSFFPMNFNSFLLLSGFFIIGLIIGASLFYSLGYSQGFNIGSIENSALNIKQELSDAKVSEITSKITSYVLANYSRSALPQGVSIIVDYNKNESLNFLSQFVIYFKNGDKKQITGLAYANEDKFILVNNFPVDLNSVNVTQKKDVNKPVVVTEVKKSDVPIVELFIWSYCPFGVTALDPFADVAKLLDANAKFEVLLYYGGHGAFEVQQNKIQSCIQKYANDKYWSYAKGFVSKIYPACGTLKDVNCDKTESTALMKSLGIDYNKIYSCVDSQGVSLIDLAAARAKTLGVTGSPTLTINGVKSNVARTAEAYKTAVCNSFITIPKTCGNVLTGEAKVASGNC